MRVRTSTLRLIAGLLTALWAAAGVLVLTGYRPGGPGDLVVGASALLPAVVAAAGIIWPPFASPSRGRRDPGDGGNAHDRKGEDPRPAAALAWLGVGSALLLAPSVAGLAGNLSGGPARPLIPSAETAYALLLPLAGTCLYTGIGLAQALLRGRVDAARTTLAGSVLALLLTLTGIGVFAGATLANDAAVRAQTGSSRWGPTGGSRLPPRCSGALATGTTAQVQLAADARVDLTVVGRLSLSGARAEDAERWDTTLSGNPVGGTFQYVRVPPNAWRRDEGGAWVPVVAGPRATLDTAVVAAALTPEARGSAEEIGVESIEGARARHCRAAIDGPIAIKAFPPLRWLVGSSPFDTDPDPQLDVWRGEIDWWVFADGQLGIASVSIHGPAFGRDWPVQGFQATVEGRLTAVDRGASQTVEPPAP
jgi:hypothetical protein